jgi:hypothetical protein
MILKWVLRKTVYEGADWIKMAQDRVQHGDVSLGCIKGGGLLNELSDYQLLNENPTP